MLVKILCMLAKSVFVGEICMLVKDVGGVCMLVKIFTNMQLLLTYLRKFYVRENHQNQIFDL